jgi:cytochrome c oxidase subunit IV
MDDINDNIIAKPIKKDKLRKILKTTLILSIVTAIEFFFTFTLERSNFLIFLLISLTIVKAFYIVGEFMHLKYEVRGLILCILLPIIFLV